MRAWIIKLIRDAVLAAALYGLYTDNQGINNIAVVFLWVYGALLAMLAIVRFDFAQKRVSAAVIARMAITAVAALYFNYVSLGVAWVLLLCIYTALMLGRSSND